MYCQNINSELLFHDPHVLEKFLESIQDEIHLPFTERVKQSEEHYDLSGRINANSN